ncbi:MAG: adenylate/guanylate cyclase domain-containing protein [Gammaproteobacteria bacterium]
MSTTESLIIPPLPTIEERFQIEMFLREARAERFACILWVTVIAITYIFLLIDTEIQQNLRRDITWLVVITVPSFMAIFFYIQSGRYHPFVAYVNTILQLTVVSGAIYLDTRAYGAQYALSSMPPIAYGLVIIVTAFRLRPYMGLFAGAMAAAQFIAIYILVGRPASDMSPELLAQVPSLDWEVTIMKVVVLLGLGAAGSYSARSLRNELYNFIATARQEMRLHQSLGRYVSSQIADALRDESQQLLATDKREVAVMFGDIRNFTKFSNSHSAAEVATHVNQFFDRADEAINAEHGVLNKFLGDGFMAIFGLFDSVEDPRIAATRAAFQIIGKTTKELADNDMGVGIAINYGEVIAGEIGSAGRCEYTVLGNTVNISARLEGLNRKLRTQLLVTQDFADALPANFVKTTSYGKHNIRGIPDAIELVELTALIDDADR